METTILLCILNYVFLTNFDTIYTILIDSILIDFN